MDTEKDRIDMEQFNLITEELKHLSTNQELLIEDFDNRVLKAIKDLQVQVKKIQNDLDEQQSSKDEPINNLKFLIDDFHLFDDTSLQKKKLDSILRAMCEKNAIIESRLKSLEKTQDFLIDDVMNIIESANESTSMIDLINKELEQVKFVNLMLIAKTFIDKEQ